MPRFSTVRAAAIILMQIFAAIILIILLAASLGAQDQLISGNLTSATCPGTGCVTLNLTGGSTGGVQVTGTWVGTLTFQGTIDGTTFFSVLATPVPSGTPTSTTTGNGAWTFGSAALRAVRVRATTYTSGTAVVNLRVSPGSPPTAPTVGVIGTDEDNVAAAQYHTSIGGVFDDTKPEISVLGRNGVFRITPNRALHVNLRNQFGGEILMLPVTITAPSGVGSPVGDSGSASTVAMSVQGVLSGVPIPVSGALSDTELRASAVPVSLASVPTHAVTGTFWQATQPVSGTFFQTTQPVSIATMPSTPVTGTFFQATQPVSGTVTATGPLTDTQLRATPVPVSGTVTSNQGGTWIVQPGNTANTTAWKVDGSAVTQPVSGAFWQATQPVSLATAPTTPVTGTFWQATQPVSGTFWQTTQPVSGTVSVTPPANQSVNIAQVGGISAATSGILAVGGNVANGATSTMFPLAMGGIFQTAPTTLTNGQTATTQYTAAQNLKVDIATIAGSAPAAVGVMTVGGSTAGGAVHTANPVSIGGIFITSPPTITNGQTAIAQFTNVQNLKTDISSVSATMPLPTGASTLTEQQTQTTSLQLIDNAVNGNNFNTLNGQTTRTAGTITSTTCPGTGCVSAVTTNYSIASVTINGTYSITPTFEFSDDGTNFYVDTCVRTDAAIQETSPGAMVNTSRAWDCSIYGSTSFRVRATAFVSGTANIGITLSSASVEAAPTVALASGTNIVGHVIDDPPTLTKGTQGATGFMTQDLKDSGRTLVTFTADNVVPILTTDTLVTFSKLVGDTVTAGVTPDPGTSGKTLRITAITLSMVATSTTPAMIRVRLRTLTTSPCIATSPVVGVWMIASPIAVPAAQSAGAALDVTIPDGMEFTGATRNLCLSMNALGAAAQTVTITVVGYEY